MRCINRYVYLSYIFNYFLFLKKIIKKILKMSIFRWHTMVRLVKKMGGGTLSVGEGGALPSTPPHH